MIEAEGGRVMRFLVLSLSSLLLSACAHVAANRDDLALDQILQAYNVITHPVGVERRGGRVVLAAQPDLTRIARELTVNRGTMVEWGAQCSVDPQNRLQDCRIFDASELIARNTSAIARWLNGLTIVSAESTGLSGSPEFRGYFWLRNAVSAPDYWSEPCNSRFFCPIIHTLERNPPPPPPPPPAAPQ